MPPSRLIYAWGLPGLLNGTAEAVGSALASYSALLATIDRALDALKLPGGDRARTTIAVERIETLLRAGRNREAVDLALGLLQGTSRASALTSNALLRQRDGTTLLASVAVAAAHQGRLDQLLTQLQQGESSQFVEAVVLYLRCTVALAEGNMAAAEQAAAELVEALVRYPALGQALVDPTLTVVRYLPEATATELIRKLADAFAPHPVRRSSDGGYARLRREG